MGKYLKEVNIMDNMQAISQRHSVRQYDERPIEGQTLQRLEEVIADCNKKGGLNIQLVLNEPKAFSGMLAHYGSFRGVKNYIALIGKKDDDLSEKVGYYGEKIVLEAQKLGLNTCWVALTYKKVKSAYKVETGEKLALVIAIGYGKTQGKPHKSKTASDVSHAGTAPDWFIRGVDAALLAPSAMDQQKFKFELVGDNGVRAKKGAGSYTAIDLGIAKYHFEVAAGTDNFNWVK